MLVEVELRVETVCHTVCCVDCDVPCKQLAVCSIAIAVIQDWALNEDVAGLE